MVLRPRGCHGLLPALTDEEKQLPLVLVGPSGAGKSSLLRAGLIPRLTGPPAGGAADAPLAALRAQLAELHAAGDTRDRRSSWTSSRRSSPSARTRPSGTSSSPRSASWPRPRWWSWRCAPTSTTLRSAIPGWPPRCRPAQVVLGPMTAEQVRRAIAEPARLARLDVEDGLVELLLRDLAPPEPAEQASRLRGRRAAAAVPCPAHHLGAQPRRHAHRRRLPGQRRHQGRAHADRRGRVRQPDRGGTAARPAPVPPAGPRRRRRAADPRHGPAERAARPGTAESGTCSAGSSANG